ncbi:MAG TPA: mannosyltransferase family protein [Ktedonobacteraceae bacterium]|nr:mannosyltransferase family protein [Ktedonobacteraceae bacterium]
MKRAPKTDILWLFLGTRLLLVVLTYIGYILFPVPPHIYPSIPVDVIGLLSSWNHWDAYNYLRIAQFGYQSVYDTAFFPLFPLLINGISFLFGHQGFAVIGMVLSNLALLGTLFVLYQIAVDLFGEQVGRRTLLYLCIFPTAFFFFAAYNESLFLFLTASAFLAMRRQKWWLVGLLGFLAALTRSAGLLLVIPYLYEVWLSRQGIFDRAGSAFSRLRQLLPRVLPIILIPLGTSIYCIYCWVVYNNPLAFASVQNHWGRETTWPWVGIWGAFHALFFVQPFGSFNEVHLLLDLSALIGFVTLAILGARKLRPSYSLWIALLLLYTFISPSEFQPDTLISTQRFVLEMFPGFITLAALGIRHPRLHQSILLAFPFIQAALALLFILNRWMV